MKAKYLLVMLAATTIMVANACKDDDSMTQSRLFRPASVTYSSDSASATYTIAWVGVKGAVGYSFDVCDSAGYSTAHVFIDDATTATVVSFDVSKPTGFAPKTKYWFRVKANSEKGRPTADSEYAGLGFTTPKWAIAQ